MAGSSALLLAAPILVRSIVDRAGDGDAVAIRTLAVGFLGVVVLGQIVEILVTRAATHTAWHTTNGLRIRLTDHVLGLDHGFHRRHTPGELIQRIDGDVTDVSDFLGRVVPRMAGALFLVVGMLVVLAVLDWRIAIGMVAYVALAGVAVAINRHRSVLEASDELGAMARLYGGIEERLNAVEDLRSNGAADHAMWRFVEDSTEAMESSIRRERTFLGMWWIVRSVVVAGFAIVLVGGVLLLDRGAITLGTAFLLFQYVLLVSRPLEEVVHELETVQKASGAMVRVLDLLDVRTTLPDDGVAELPDGALRLRFDRVDFDYGDDQPVLHGVSLDIAPGRSVGVVGRTGSGKTTLSRLVLRLVDPTSGAVELGGIDARQVPLAAIRSRTALVPQEVELFAGSIRDNVTLFDPTPTDEAVIDALRRVGLDRLAATGIGRQLGPGGTGLSAGEAQLLALARVWLRDPDLVVLDEATARVDPATERRLEDAIRELRTDRTVVVIAHRLSTLRVMDEIVVVEAGRVVEHGDRLSLLGDEDSRFTRLVRLALDDDEQTSSDTSPGPTPSPAATGADHVGSVR